MNFPTPSTIAASSKEECCNPTSTSVILTEERTRCAHLGRYLGLLFCVLVICSGCPALHPMDGIPASYIPREFIPPTKDGKETINPQLLKQTPPPVYLLDTGDLLGVYVDGILGNRGEAPPVYFSENGEIPPSMGFPIPVRDDGTISLPLLRPIMARGLSVRQLEERIRQVYTTQTEIINPGRDRIFVSLQRPRTYEILVIRQEEGASTQGGQGGFNMGTVKRGTGHKVVLPAYKNDVLNVLADSSGFPGLDAENAIYIIRGKRAPRQYPTSSVWGYGPQPVVQPGFQPGMTSPVAPGIINPAQPSVPQNQQSMPTQPGLPNTMPQLKVPQGSGMPMQTSQASYSTQGGHSSNILQVGHSQPSVNPYSAVTGASWGSSAPMMNTMSGSWGSGWGISPQMPTMQSMMYSGDPTVANPNVTKIPIRLSPGEQIHFSEQDVTLYDGDIVFIESRDTEVFYTGGLLGGGQYTLPRDYDLDVLEAIAIAQGNGNSVGESPGGMSALSQDVVISASQVVILRKLPNGTQVPIKVDLYKARKNPQERILVQPGDYIFLQYSPLEAVTAFVERHLLEGVLFTVGSNFINPTGGGN